MAFSVRAVLVNGASRGLGLELVSQFLALPTPPELVIGTCRSPDTATRLQDMARTNPSLKIIKLDIENDDDIENAFKETEALVGKKGLNILVNNAGHYDQSDPGDLKHVSREGMLKHYNINTAGHVMVVKKFLPLLELAVAERGSKTLNCQAQVVMISSLMGSLTMTYREGRRICLHYKCSKTAAIMAGIMVSRELRDVGIHVLLVHPGFIQTDMGGPEANISTQESVAGCFKLIGSSTEATSGVLFQFTGDELPY